MKKIYSVLAALAVLIGFASVVISCGSSSSPTSSATPTPTAAVPTATATLVCSHAINFGYTTAGSGGAKANSFIQAEVVTFSIPVTVHALSVQLGSVGGGNTVLGLYTDNSGVPGTLIASGVVNDTVSVGNSATFAPVALPAGTYWLAFENSVAATDYIQETTSVSGSQLNYTYNGTLPGTWSGLSGTVNAYNLVAQSCY